MSRAATEILFVFGLTAGQYVRIGVAESGLKCGKVAVCAGGL